MPQIPGLPIDEPVAMQKAKPAIYGSVGDTIAGLGEQTEQMAQANMAFEGHLIYAQRQLKAKEAEIAIDKYMNQVYANLNKTTSVEDAQSVIENSQNPSQVGPLLAPYEKDPRLHQMVTLAWQQAQVHLQSQGNEHKARIIVAGTHEADALNAEKTVGQAVGVTMTGGDKQPMRDRYEMGLQAGMHSGVYTPQAVAGLMYDWDQKYMNDLAGAMMDSPQHSVRQQAINQLKSGGGAFSVLDQTTRNALFAKAESHDRELTNLAESLDYNGAITRFNELSKGWSYESKFDALDSDDWLRKNGFLDANGNPDHAMATKVGQEINRQRAQHDGAQKEKDEGILEKYSPMIDAHQLTIPQIDSLMQTQGASVRAVGALKSQWYHEQREARAEARFAKSEARSDRQEKRQALQDRSDQTSLDLWKRIESGDTLDLTSDVYEQVGNGNLTKGQAATIVQGYNKSKQSEDYNYGLGIINKSPLDNVTRGRLKDQFTKKVHEESTKPEDMAKTAQELVDGAGHKATGNFIQNLWNTISHGPAAPAPVQQSAPARPEGVPDNAVWNSETKTWQLQQ